MGLMSGAAQQELVYFSSGEKDRGVSGKRDGQLVVMEEDCFREQKGERWLGLNALTVLESRCTIPNDNT